MTNTNCWSFMKCGQEDMDSNSNQCPAVIADEFDGVNRGVNGGRICWVIAGTFCEGEMKGKYAHKNISCMGCDFFTAVINEEEKFVLNKVATVCPS